MLTLNFNFGMTRPPAPHETSDHCRLSKQTVKNNIVAITQIVVNKGKSPEEVHGKNNRMTKLKILLHKITTCNKKYDRY